MPLYPEVIAFGRGYGAIAEAWYSKNEKNMLTDLMQIGYDGKVWEYPRSVFFYGEHLYNGERATRYIFGRGIVTLRFSRGAHNAAQIAQSSTLERYGSTPLKGLTEISQRLSFTNGIGLDPSGVMPQDLAAANNILYQSSAMNGMLPTRVSNNSFSQSTPYVPGSNKRQPTHALKPLQDGGLLNKTGLLVCMMTLLTIID